jgi:hypothetical protein
MDYISLSLIGGMIFLFTSLFDYYSERKMDEISNTDTPSHPSDITVGSKPNSPKYAMASISKPQPIGYIIAVLCQLPLILSIIGII